MAFKLKKLRTKAGRATERLTGPWGNCNFGPKAYLSLYSVHVHVHNNIKEGGLKKFIKTLEKVELYS